MSAHDAFNSLLSSRPQTYKQRIKHLLFEHQSAATESRTDGVVSMKVAQEQHRGSEADLRVDARDLKATLREIESAHDEFIK